MRKRVYTILGLIALAISESGCWDVSYAGRTSTWCLDEDEDGFGDPNVCTEVSEIEQPPPKMVANADDCDDSNQHTYPGAGEHEISGESLCQKDNDGDGFGDSAPPDGVAPGSDCDDASATTKPGIEENPFACYRDNDHDGQGDANPPSGVSPGTDCDDNDPNTFTGAAPNDDRDACMTDADGDDWGHINPDNPHSTPGTDCDDNSANTYVGAAENEDPTACMRDEDGDGWGSTKPWFGVEVGSDCHDSNTSLNPDTMKLVSLTTTGVQKIDIESGELTQISNTPTPTVQAAALDPVQRTFFVVESGYLVSLDYCGDTNRIIAFVGNLCGLTRTHDGKLYGVDSQTNNLVELNIDTGEVVSMKPILNELEITGCDMTYDCVHDALLVSVVNSEKVYRLEPDTGHTTVVADVTAGVYGQSIAYDPRDKNVHSSRFKSSITIEIDGSNVYRHNPDLAQDLTNLEYGPLCD